MQWNFFDCECYKLKLGDHVVLFTTVIAVVIYWHVYFRHYFKHRDFKLVTEG